LASEAGLTAIVFLHNNICHKRGIIVVSMYKHFRTVYSVSYSLAVALLIGLYFTINQTSPFMAGHLSVILFYVLLFGFVVACITPVGLSIRRRFATAPFGVLLKSAFRQSVALAILAVVSLVLQSQGLLSWFVAASLLLFFLSVEVFLSI
jgi:hypothetical protein